MLNAYNGAHYYNKALEYDGQVMSFGSAMSQTEITFNPNLTETAQK